MKQVLVRITRADIDAGVRRSCNRCPVALALQRTWPAAEVGTVTWTEDEYHRGRALPFAAKRFIRTFDAGQPVEPFDFEVEG